MKTILFTTEFKRLDKKSWPKYVMDFIENPDVNSIHSECGSKIAFHRFNTEAYPRLLFFEEIRDENVVLVIRKYFDNHREYDNFRKLTDAEQLKKCKYSQLDNEEIETKFSEFVANQTKEILPIEMHDYEKQREFSNTGTTYVFEMEEWCKNLRNPEFRDDKREIYKAIQNVIIEKSEEVISGKVCDNDWRLAYFAGNKEIAFRIHSVGSRAYYYLFDIALHIDLDKLQDKYIDLKDENLLKQARKGYPDWILCGEFEEWNKLENDDDASLALSDEEVRVLNNTKYPYFINGLAGSGKSTILYYLFAHAYSYKNEKVNPLDMLFLSYSNKLVEKAKVVIKALLSTNTSYHNFQLTDEEKQKLENCFWPFQSFLKTTFLRSDEEFSRFSSLNHLSYDQFQTDYVADCKLNEADKYSAAIVWSVIRSFIKGRDYKHVFTIDLYNKLPETDRTVTQKDFENIYKIYKNWYKPTYEKRWDDLDLVIHILKKLDDGFKCKQYDVIYCDEVQDFTPIENDLILRLSKYTNYDLKGFDRIPIAYAGDPNQTVSPTGFNWKRLKDVFNYTFSEIVGNHIKLREQTLNNNYRSKKAIVEFANSIQYIRKTFLTDDTLVPQEQWNPQSTALPGFFFVTTDGSRTDDAQTIKEGFAKAECIITGAEGEYEKELDNNNLTADSTRIEDELLASVDNKTKLYTAISSKGLEFPAVLLYRFADQLPKSFSKILNHEEIINESDKYELSHFFTKLYIAVSRAKNVLYIADTQENYDRFWIYFVDNKFVKGLLENKQDKDVWENKICGIELGKGKEFLDRMEENFNPLETAQRIFEDAKLSNNAKDMNRASGYFEEAGNNTMAEECKAYVLLYEKKYQLSGNKFLERGKIDDATKAFWKGECWDELIKHSDRVVYKFAAQFMTGKLSLDDFISKENIISYFESRDEIWQNVVLQIGREAKKISSELIFRIRQKLDQLSLQGFKSLDPTIAELYFKNRQFEEAVEKWDELADTTKIQQYKESKDYYHAKEKLSKSISEKIFWMDKGGKQNEILNTYSDPRDIDAYLLDERAQRIIFLLLLKPKTFNKALAYPIKSEDKYSQLYRIDKFQFIENCVLDDFSEGNFYKWIEIPLKDNDINPFASPDIPITLLEKIFSLEQSEWSFFMRLKDSKGYTVIKDAANINKLISAVNNALIKADYDIYLASCFLDVLFNNSQYNYANAKQYTDTLISLFSTKQFYTDDFILASQKNKYFASVGLEGSDVDNIKDNLRGFVSVKIGSYKKIKESDINHIKVLCNIFEKVVPRTRNKQGRFVYDCENAIQFYNQLRQRKFIPEELKDFITIRCAILTARYQKLPINDFMKSLPESCTIQQVISVCDKEDVLWLIGYMLGKQRVDKYVTKEWLRALTKMVYTYNVKFENLDYMVRENIQTNFINYADETINELLLNDDVDIYEFKLTAYLYEVFVTGNERVSSNKYKAEKYDKLAKDNRIKDENLVEYIQHRALHYYAYFNKYAYEQKLEEYTISLPIEKAKENVRPVIEDEYKRKVQKTTPAVKAKDVGAAKKAELDMARSLKNNGVPVEIILQSSKLLTIEEIKEL